MSDTIKTVRPKFPRRQDGPGGRVEHDSRGNAVWVRTRATDAPELAISVELKLADDAHSAKPLDDGTSITGMRLAPFSQKRR